MSALLSDMAARIGAAFSSLADAAVLRVGGADHACQCWEEMSEVASAGQLRVATDRLFCVLAAAGLPTPRPGDRLVLAGGEVLTVQAVAGDGCGAVLRITARR